MNYIVFDLEWNQSSIPELEEKRMPIEIIEIGAVKLDSDFNLIDEYQSLVKPRLYKKIHSRVKEILTYDESELRLHGRPFDVVCREFLKWCGKEEYRFCTWGSCDLFQLQKNMDYYYMKPLPFPLPYYDLQEIYGSLTNQNTASSLEHAIRELDIPIIEPFHCAVNDARYTAYVFQNISKKDLQDKYCMDYYRHPASKDEEVYSYHKTYSEHISRAFPTKQLALEQKEINTLYCHKCKRKISKKIKWFANTQNSYICAGKCWTHGYICGKIRFKTTNDDQYFVIKKSYPIHKSDIESIKNRQKELREKRRLRRIQKKGSNIELS